MTIRFHEKLMAKSVVKRIYILSAFSIMFYAVWLPDFGGVGIQNIKVSSTAAFGPLNGILLGPYWGAAVSLSVGVLHHLLYRPGLDNTFVILTPLFLMISSLVAGFIVRKKEKIALSIYFVLMISWYLFDTGRDAYLLPWFDILTISVFLIFHRTVKDKFESSNIYTFVYLFLVSLVAVLSDQMTGSIVAIIVLDLPAHIFNEVLLIYPVERMILAFVGALIAYLLIKFEQYIIESIPIVADDMKKAKMDSYQRYIQDVKKIMNEKHEK